MGETPAALTQEDAVALAVWDVGAIVAASVPETGTVNRTLIVRSHRGRFVLRVSTRGKERVEWEQKCIAWAADHGVPVCRPLTLPNGATILEREGSCYALFPFAAGQQIHRAELSAEHAQAAGECLARIHEAFQTFPVRQSRIKHLTIDPSMALENIPKIEAAIRSLPLHTDIDLAALRQLAERHERLRVSLSQSAGVSERLTALSQAIVHGDYQETNLFFENGSVSAVIDWDQSGLAAQGWEVVRALHLMLCLDPELCRAFLVGYRPVVSLSDDELQEAAVCYGALSDCNLWVYQATYLEGNERAKQFIRPGPFIPFLSQWQAVLDILS